MKNEDIEQMTVELNLDWNPETELRSIELWGRLLEKPEFELEDYNDWLDALDPGSIEKLSNDPETMRWLARWDEPRFRRFFPVADYPEATV